MLDFFRIVGACFKGIAFFASIALLSIVEYWGLEHHYPTVLLIILIVLGAALIGATAKAICIRMSDRDCLVIGWTLVYITVLALLAELAVPYLKN